ncbi:MAG: glycerophosphodiester phosphodiesterase [Sphingobacteriales bacterium]|jgi:glycerophosphoryl diester phosphodiesterase|nr:glycerophosphodiester phosphodiesterase [Sphingobacteriales bacterium]
MQKTLLLLAILTLTSCASKNINMTKPSFHKNKVIAHRGAWKGINTSQNSIASLKQAIALGCYGSELDLHMTSDSILIVNHDITWGGLNVQKSTLAELRKTPLSNGEPLPLLEDMLKIIKNQTGTKLILEIKSSDRGREWANATVKKIVNAIRDYKAQEWISYIAFDYEICKEVLRLNPSADVQYLMGNKAPDQLKKDGIKGADYHYSVYQSKPEWIQQAKQLGIILNAWTVDKLEEMQWLLNRDIDMITTDEPEMLFKELERRKK